MKLFRFGPAGAERPGVVAPGSGDLVDASGFGEDWSERFFETDGLSRLAAWVQANAGDRALAPRVPSGARLGPAVARPSKIVCIGLNYRGHAQETGAAIPAEPVVFMKASSAWAGASDDLVLPRGSVKTDWEVELAFVIGKRASYVPAADALSHIAGFAVHNDYSEREYQTERGGQWTKGKSADGFASFGPYLVTPDEFPDFARAHLWLKVNGAMKQDSTTADLIFDVPTVLSYLSRFMTLLPGDVVSTGTPAGVGTGHKPPVFLRAGDVVEYGVDGLGQVTQKIVAGAPA
ncbi:MAG TPA: fumarylacetoacetate hydrolase family protein [Polyangia bacterium]|nr:fumarylacetoacetate hydrolase family protein [Polyangia bacterium]